MNYIDLELETNYNSYHFMKNKTYHKGDKVVYKSALYECLVDQSYGDDPINSNNWRIIK